MLGFLKGTFRKHTLATIYTLVIILLVIGVYANSGFTHMGKIGFYLLALYGSYIFFNRSKVRAKLASLISNIRGRFTSFNVERLLIGLSIYTIATIIVHFIVLKGVPSIQAMSIDSSIDVALLRTSIKTESAGIMGYISSFNLRAFLPFLIFYFYLKNKKGWYWLLLLVGVFYAFSLMQKSYIICVLAPVLCYAFIRKDFLMGIKHIFLIGAVVFSLFKIANPDIRRETEAPPEATMIISADSTDTIFIDKPEETKKVSANARLIQGLYKRLVYTPGEMISRWFDIIPNEKPFLYGDGYRIVAKLKNSEYHNYSAELYPLIRPRYAERNLKGSVNVANFVVDYANFGIAGLILSGIILSLLFIFVESLFEGDFKSKLSLNLYSLLIISSTALTTTLFSGGWFFILVLYFVFIKQKDFKEATA